MSRLREKKRERVPESLSLPHGDPAPSLPRRGQAWGAPPKVTQQGGGIGTYTAVGYRSARMAEREQRSPSRSGAIIHERVDRLKLQYQSREFVRNNGLYKGMLARARSYIIGRGFKLTCKTKSSKWNRLVEKAWRRWWARPEITGKFSGPRLEKLICDELLTCGEVAAIPTHLDLLQGIEAEQIIGHDWLNQGIDRDDTGKPIRFWVSPYDKNNGVPLRYEAKSYKPEQIFYVASQERLSSVRSVPPCQAAFPMLHRIDDVCNAEAIAWQMQARIALISNRLAGMPMPGAISAANQNREPIDGDATQNYITELDYALIFHGKPGEDVKGMERTAPGSQFPETLTMFFRLLGLPLGLPLELILLDWTKSNYSQSRAVLEQAFTTFLEWQDLIEDQFHRPVFEWWLKRAIERGEIPDREDALEHDWIRPTFPWIDQLQEAEAQGEKVDRGFTSYTSVLKSLNEEREDVLEQIKLETIEAIEISQFIEEQTGVHVPWEQFAGKKAFSAPQGSKPVEENAQGDKNEPGQNQKPGADKSGKKPKPNDQPNEKQDAAEGQRSRSRARRPRASRSRRRVHA